MSRLVVRLRVAGGARPEWQAKTPGQPWRPIEDVFAELPGLWVEWSRVLEDPSRLAAMRTLGLPEEAVRARRVADEARMRERLTSRRWHREDEPIAAFCAEMEQPLRMDPDEVEAIMRAGTWLDRYLDDREAEYQVHQAREAGYPCILMVTCQKQPRCEGPATLAVYERDEKWEREWPATRAKFTADVLASLRTETAQLASRNFLEAMAKEPTPKIY